MPGTASGTAKCMYRTVYVMPREEYQSISIPQPVYEDATHIKEQTGLTWEGLIREGINAIQEDDALSDVRVVEIEPGALEELTGRVAREVREELQGGTF